MCQMWHHISSQVKGKHKQGESSSSSSQARSDTSAYLFVVIESFHFISFSFSFTLDHFEFIVIFYLIYVIFLFAGHNDLSTAIIVAFWGAAWPGEALNSRASYGQRDQATCSRGGGFHGAGHPRGARGPLGGSQGAEGSSSKGGDEEGAHHGGDQQPQ
jgi:hypothetical protein